LLGGFVIIAAGIAMTVHADLGLAPWDVFHQGVALRTGLSFGTATMVVGAGVFVFWFPLRQRPGIGTILNVLLIGPCADLWLFLLPVPHAMPWRIAYLVVGATILGVGGGFYIGAGLGPGPRDGLMTGLAARGLPVRWVRTVLEVAATGAGWMLGGSVGAGTVLVALSIGHIIEPTLAWSSRINGQVPVKVEVLP